MKSKYSKYEAKLARRKGAGEVRMVLTIDAQGHPTLNPEQFVFGPDGQPKTRTFVRIKRADEVNSEE
jgi:hypothetical protein